MGKVIVRGFDAISKKIGEVGPELHRQLKGALQESLEDGRDEMRRRIESGGTGKTWVANWDRWANAHPGRRASSPGRVASGRMRDRVTFEMSSDTKYRVRGRVGWTGRLGKDRYFVAQDQGFRHHITGERVQGMMILRDIGNFVDQRFEERAERIARSIADLDF